VAGGINSATPAFSEGEIVLGMDKLEALQVGVINES
jgi:hypothetical protein